MQCESHTLKFSTANLSGSALPSTSNTKVENSAHWRAERRIRGDAQEVGPASFVSADSPQDWARQHQQRQPTEGEMKLEWPSCRTSETKRNDKTGSICE